MCPEAQPDRIHRDGGGPVQLVLEPVVRTCAAEVVWTTASTLTIHH